MKKIISTYIVITLFTACTSGLSHTEAEGLISKVIGLPKTYIHTVYNKKRLCWGSDLTQFGNDGLITFDTHHSWEERIDVFVTAKGKPWYVGKNSKGWQFKMYRIVFGSVTGISMNESKTIATIRFTLKADGITPFARSLANGPGPCNTSPAIEFDLDKPVNSELIFRKFDTGWQLDEEASGKNLEELMNNIKIHTI